MAIKQKQSYRVDLVQLQTIYEHNYRQLKRILLKIREVGYSRRIAFTAEQKNTTVLIFSVLENSPYTSYLELKQDNLIPWLPSPMLYIRCYHDAQLAEITLAQNTRSFQGKYAYPNKNMHQPDEKRQLNLFLKEWLNRCLIAGYEVAVT